VERDVKHAKTAQVASATALVSAETARDIAQTAYSDSVGSKVFKIKRNQINGVKLSWAFFLTSTTALLKALAEAQKLVNTRDAEDTACRAQVRVSEQAVLACTQEREALLKELSDTVTAWTSPPANQQSSTPLVRDRSPPVDHPVELNKEQQRLTDRENKAQQNKKGNKDRR
jgi:hypothetical protein